MNEASMENYAPFVISHPKESAENLRTAMDERGYVFIPGLVPADVVLQVRRDILLLCAEAGSADLLSVEPDDVLLHTRRIGRITFPNNPEATTPPHQDHFYIRGTVDTYSCWMPLGACPVSLGGLAVAPGTHRWGFQEHSVKVPAAVGGRGVPVDDIEEWHTSDFAPGDALLFQSYTVHKALPNESGDRLRISTDNRYQRKDEDIDPGALRVHYDL